MNSKGFTLTELLATIVVLAILLGIGSYSIMGIINKSKEDNYKLLINNIKDAANDYYNECTYMKTNGNICRTFPNITLGELVEYGFLKGNKKNGNNFSIENPMNNQDISNCLIKVSYSNGIVVNNLGCPNYD